MKHDYTDEEIKEAENEAYRTMPVAKEHEWVKAFLAALPERDKAQGILKDCLAVMPFGNIETHTAENLPGRIADLASEIAAVSSENERLESELAAIRQPILADDGRTLDEVYMQAYNDAPDDSSVHEASKIALRAVAAVVLAQAVRGQAEPQAVVVNERAQDERQPDLSGESEKQAQPATAEAGPEEVPWIPHDGGNCPLMDKEVAVWEVKWKGKDVVSDTYRNLKPSRFTGWGDIEAYRVLVWRQFNQATAQPAPAKPVPPVSDKEITDMQAEAQPWTPENAKAFEEFQSELQATWEAHPWTPAVRPTPEKALGGQMYWRDLAIQLARVWWKCHGIGASLQHGDLDKDIAFSVVCERHGGKVFHADSPENAWHKAEEWLLSPDRENFPAACLTPVPNP